MSILTRVLRRIGDELLPGRCLLCGERAVGGPLCAPCDADLPALPAARCPQCGDSSMAAETCGHCQRQPPHFSACHAALPYAFPVDRLVQALKYGHQLALAPWFGRRLAATVSTLPDLVVALPLHPSRLRERGFNQAVEIARTLATCLDRPLLAEGFIRSRATQAQADLPLSARAANVRGAFESRIDFGGRSVLLVDDVMTSGATLDEAARVLRLHGAGNVAVAVVARALR